MPQAGVYSQVDADADIAVHAALTDTHGVTTAIADTDDIAAHALLSIVHQNAPALIAAHAISSAHRWTDEKLRKGAGAGADPDEIDIPAYPPPTRSMWVFPGHGPTDQPTYFNEYAVHFIDTAGQRVVWSIKVPADFSSLTSVIVWCFGVDTGTMDWTALTRFAAEGEDNNAHSDIVTADGEVMTNLKIKSIDITAAFTGLAAGDVAGVEFKVDAFDTTTGLFVLGLQVQYSE